ncbi:hypothetical protein F2P56_026931 [Juglans regia]|uniref:Uncharacterized protein n=2 Tax=Juglans regia TaxID=51240 RepID=A0A833X0Z8_JUGRE|nr:uncharacterized protein LOC108988746 [Juglans regia]KAF5451871.1 hypothetical protein F2P56_026931 [Juglans regia]
MDDYVHDMGVDQLAAWTVDNWANLKDELSRLCCISTRGLNLTISGLKDLEFELAASSEKLIRLSPQFLATMFVRNRAFCYGYGYGASLERLKAFLLVNPQTDLRTLNLESSKPDRASRQFVDAWEVT